MAIAATVTPAASATEPMKIAVTGATAAQVLTLARQIGSVRERLAGSQTADGSGNATFNDWLYPFDSAVTYLVLDSAGAVLLAQAATVASPSSEGFPYIRDTYLPGTLSTRVWVMDVTARLRAGRVATYRPTGKRYPITIGDVRQASEGTLTLYCPSHQYRNTLIEVLSTGNPCVLRVPGLCRTVVDDMFFTPLDVDELRLGASGACQLDVDFVEVEAANLPAFIAIAYSVQTSNAAAATAKYGNLTANFAGRSYLDMTTSPTGVTPV